MRARYTIILAPALVLAAACSSKDRPVAADSALSNDLTLAGQARSNATMDSISAAERLRTTAAAPAGAARRPAAPRTSSTTRRTVSSSGSVAPAQREVEVKHTKRDAAIGAAAGAIIGATTSKDKVKGGIIGAAAGGILGGVIGNNVDKGKKKVP